MVIPHRLDRIKFFKINNFVQNKDLQFYIFTDGKT